MMEAASSERARVVAGCEARLSLYGGTSPKEEWAKDRSVGTQNPRGFASAPSQAPTAT
jgi:hypothetical protein